MSIAVHGGFLVTLEQDVGALGELAGKTAVACFVHEELAVATLRWFAIQGEPLALLCRGVEAEQVPVPAVDGLAHLGLGVEQTAFD